MNVSPMPRARKLKKKQSPSTNAGIRALAAGLPSFLYMKVMYMHLNLNSSHNVLVAK